MPDSHSPQFNLQSSLSCAYINFDLIHFCCTGGKLAVLGGGQMRLELAAGSFDEDKYVDFQKL